MDMNFENMIRKFSVVNQCQKCGELALSYKNGLVLCNNCGYSEKISSEVK